MFEIIGPIPIRHHILAKFLARLELRLCGRGRQPQINSRESLSRCIAGIPNPNCRGASTCRTPTDLEPWTQTGYAQRRGS
jgi:hypothetical protein